MTLSEFYNEVRTFKSDLTEVYVFGVDEINETTMRFDAMFCLCGQYKSSVYLKKEVADAIVVGIYALEQDVFFVEIDWSE